MDRDFDAESYHKIVSGEKKTGVVGEREGRGGEKKKKSGWRGGWKKLI